MDYRLLGIELARGQAISEVGAGLWFSPLDAGWDGAARHPYLVVKWFRW